MSDDPSLDRIQLEAQSLWERIAQTTSAKRLPSVLLFTGGREFTRSVGNSMARTRGRRELIALEGPGAASGSWGAESETWVRGLGLALSLGPAVEDLLAEPTSSNCGVLLPSNLERSIKFLKNRCQSPGVKYNGGGRGGGPPPVEAVEIQHYQYY